MDRAALLARAQAFAEQGMVDTCLVERATGASRDDFSGTVTSTYDEVYAGKCRMQQEQLQAEQHDVGQDYQLLQRTQLQLPVSVLGLQVGDRVTMTASRDPDLVDRQFLIRDLAHKTDASARRVTVTERTE